MNTLVAAATEHAQRMRLEGALALWPEPTSAMAGTELTAVGQ